jgi:hypothetical protein
MKYKQGKAQFIGGILTLMLMIGGISFEISNAITTNSSLNEIIRTAFLANVLTVAFVAIDFGALARIFTPETGDKEEPLVVLLLGAAWLIVAMGNTMLTWWHLSVVMESNGVIAPRAMHGFVEFLPGMLAVMVFLIRVVLIYSLGVVLDKWIHGGARVGSPVEHLITGRAKSTKVSMPANAARTAPQPEGVHAQIVRPSEGRMVKQDNHRQAERPWK